MSPRVMTFLKVAISVALIGLLLLRVDVGAVWATLRGTRLPLLLLAMVLYGGAVASNAIKWGTLLRAQGVRAPLSSLLRHTFVGVFFNNFMPFIGADMIRGYGLVRETAATADVAVSVVVDRLVGLLAFTSAGALSALVAVRVFGIDEPALLVVEQVGLLLTVVLAIGFGLLLSGRLRRLVERLVARVPRLGPLVPLVGNLSAAVGSYRTRPGALLAAYGVGLVTILLSNLVNWLLFEAILAPNLELIDVFHLQPDHRPDDGAAHLDCGARGEPTHFPVAVRSGRGAGKFRCCGVPAFAVDHRADERARRPNLDGGTRADDRRPTTDDRRPTTDDRRVPLGATTDVPASGNPPLGATTDDGRVPELGAMTDMEVVRSSVVGRRSSDSNQ